MSEGCPGRAEMSRKCQQNVTEKHRWIILSRREPASNTCGTFVCHEATSTLKEKQQDQQCC